MAPLRQQVLDEIRNIAQHCAKHWDGWVFGLLVLAIVSMAGYLLVPPVKHQLSLEPFPQTALLTGQAHFQATTIDEERPPVVSSVERRSASQRSKPKTKSPPPVINLNTASTAQLELLPGIGPALAQRVHDYHRDNGPFQSVEEIQAVSGIGPKKFDAIKIYLKI